MLEFLISIIENFNPLWLLFPLVGALVGWVTNYLAVKMLFRPRRQLNFIFFKVHGVFPKRQAVLAEKISHLVSTELLAGEEFEANIHTAVAKLDLRKIIVEEIDQIIMKKLPAEVPMVGMFLNNELADKIKQLIARELHNSLSSTISRVGTEISREFDLRDSIEDKILKFSSHKMEELILSVMSQELKFIEFFGALIGFVIGVIQIVLVHLIGI